MEREREETISQMVCGEGEGRRRETATTLGLGWIEGWEQFRREECPASAEVGRGEGEGRKGERNPWMIGK